MQQLKVFLESPRSLRQQTETLLAAAMSDARTLESRLRECGALPVVMSAGGPAARRVLGSAAWRRILDQGFVTEARSLVSALDVAGEAIRTGRRPGEDDALARLAIAIAEIEALIRPVERVLDAVAAIRAIDDALLPDTAEDAA